VRRVSAPIPSPIVVSVGAGASTLIGDLVEAGCAVVAVDIAEAALATLTARLPEADEWLRAGRLQLVVSDVRTLELDEPVDVWHDRAMFHFLVEPSDQAAYAAAAGRAVKIGGHLVIATFAPSGPTTCSGLPVTRHDAESLAAVFSPQFRLVDSFEADHITPWGAPQRFVHAVLVRA
jgi:SAM-dependent methyltransferase